MREINRIASIVALVAAAGTAATASASVIVTYGFDELKGSYNSVTDHFVAESVLAAGDIKTQGDVSRVIATVGTALYAEGFSETPAHFLFECDVPAGGGAASSAYLTITDSTGDTIKADVTGKFSTPGFGIVYFNGTLANVTFNGLDGSFDGPSGGSFDYSVFQNFTDPLTGAITLLFIKSGVGFFFSSFDNVSVESTGNIVPAPGSVALVGLGLAGLVARRRAR